MKRIIECSQIPMKTCSLCNKSTEVEGIALVYFGEWMSKKDITVHYYCLLLSTNLPQRGGDGGGILGFLLIDIRNEIRSAENRKCKYCFEMSATIQCAVCKKYFHLTCGHTSKSLFRFVGEFKSFCHACVPEDQFQMALFGTKALSTELCFICGQVMGTSRTRWIYAKCCGKGFTHSKCMKIYALSAGYYLTCIWCKDKRFREDVKYLGVFVPDREANWEKEKGAYQDLYRVRKSCDMEICNCPRGRNYSNSIKWQLIICNLCGAFGAHNPLCIPGFEDSKEKLLEFKCDICSVTERTVFNRTIAGLSEDLIDASLYVTKNATSAAESITISQCINTNNSVQDIASQETTVHDKTISTPAVVNNLKTGNAAEAILYTLTQSPQISQQVESQESCYKMEQEEASDSDDSVIAELLVQKIMDAFEVL